MKKGWLVVISLAAAIALLGAVGCAVLEREVEPALAADTGNPQQRGIWVSGQGRVSVTPDIAVLMLGVEAQADTVAEARGKAAEAMAAIMTALKANGVTEKDIRTYHFSIYQMRKWDWAIARCPVIVRNDIPRDAYPICPTVVTGYWVSSMVSATIRELDKVGLIMDAVAAAGGDFTRIHGVSFTVEDPTAYQKQARAKAFADAKAKAEQLASLAGVTLGKAIYITEPMAWYMPPMPMPPVMPMVVEEVFVTPIMPGEQEIVIEVQVAFAIE